MSALPIDKQLEDAVAKITGKVNERATETATALKAVETKTDGVVARIGEVTTELERQKKVQEQLVKDLQTQIEGLSVPGAEDQTKNFNFGHVIQACGAKKGIEYIKQLDAEANKSRPQRKRWCSGEVLEQCQKLATYTLFKTMVASNDESGGFLIPLQMLGEMIPILRAQSIFLNPDAKTGNGLVTFINGLSGPVGLNKLATGVTMGPIGELKAYPKTDVKLGRLTARPKKYGGESIYSEELVLQSNDAIQSILRNDFVEAAGPMIDLAILYGKGAENEVTGLTTEIADSAPAPGTGVDLDFKMVKGMSLAISEAKVPGEPISIMNPRAKYTLSELRSDAYSGQAAVNQLYLTGVPFLTDEALQRIIGGFRTSTTIPVTNGSGANLADLFVGVWKHYMLFMFNGFFIGTNENTYWESDGIAMKARWFIDGRCRYTEAFRRRTDAKLKTP